MKVFRNIFFVLAILFIMVSSVFSADSASAEFSVTIPKYIQIRPVTSPVLTANITNRTGNLHAPLNTKFRVVTNSSEPRKLYLSANTVTDVGYEEAMFEQGGRVYVAFANLAKIPKSSALVNCKMGGMPKDSPGIVAYPITSIRGGTNHKFLKGEERYELTVGQGITDISVNIGSNVLQSSFASNDPRGFYQAVLSLTEADM